MTEENNDSRGLIMVYTGEGKGKTTAAIGQALRAIGHGYRVYLLHFMKGRDYGEFWALEKMPGVTIIKAGRDEFVHRINPDPVDVKLAMEGWESAREAIFSDNYDMVVLDEINVALDFGLIPGDEVIEVLRDKPRHVDIILTGRNALPQIIKIADLVSEVKEIKHHYSSGVDARAGIEH